MYYGYGYGYYHPSIFSSPVYWTVVIICWVVWIIVSRVIANIFFGMDERKGYHGNHHYWALCFWLGILGIVISIAIAVSVPENRDNRSNSDENHYGSIQDNNKGSSILAEGLKEIGEKVCASDVSIVDFELPKSTEIIGKYAFANCRNMKSVILNEGLKEIRIGAFEGCSALKSIEIPASVRHIGQWVFYLCSSLEDITFKEVHEWYATQGEDSEAKVKTATFSSIKPSELGGYCWHRADK